MNYLGKHLNNSSILPYDIMAQVQQYADPLFAIRNQIENKDYDLEEIMYQRMKTYIKQMPFVRISYELNHKEYGKKLIKIKLNNSNIDNRAYKDAILNYHCGYKEYILRSNLRKINEDMICGLNPYQKELDFEKSINLVDKKLIENIFYSYRQEKHGVCFNTYYVKELYKIWVKL